jgi:hypothetical protein
LHALQLFLMVARNVRTKKSSVVTQLVRESARDERAFARGEKNKLEREAERSHGLHVERPTEVRCNLVFVTLLNRSLYSLSHHNTRSLAFRLLIRFSRAHRRTRAG